MTKKIFKHQSTTISKKSNERGYTVVFAIFCVLVLTVLTSLGYLLYVTNLNYEIAVWNQQLISQGFYQLVPSVCPDYSVFNWAIAAESTAFGVAAAAQASKKKSNNNYKYMEEFIMEFADKYGIESVSNILVSFLGTNQNNG